jgi:phage terminase large subunit-like protein
MRLVAERIRENPWVPHLPTIKQLDFIASPEREKLYGGAAGSGKSDALLMDALLYADIPGYAALLLRRTYADLSLPGALMDRAHDWLGNTAARWNEQTKTWTFPSDATLTFGYLDGPRDHFRYQGAEFQKVGFDELTQFRDEQYRYLLSRLRRLALARVPVGAAGATNPGGIGHQWVYERFVVDSRRNAERVFVSALLDDNPHLDREEYEHSLSQLDPITYEQLRRGAWLQDETGHPFKREYWRGKNRYVVGSDDVEVVARWISWDTAIKDTEGSAYNVAVVFELLADYRVRVRFVWREKLTFPELVPVIEELASQWDYDGLLRGVIIEDKATGTTAYQTIMSGANSWLARLLLLFNPGQAGKVSRWSQAAVWCKRDCVEFPYPSGSVPWLQTFESEILSVPDSEYKDQADAFAQGIIYLEHYIAEGYRARLAAA